MASLLQGKIISGFEMKQKNVQTQNVEERTRIRNNALFFRNQCDLPRALLDCFEALGIDLKRDILTANDRMPFGGPTWSYRGVWLTEQLQFINFVIFLDEKDEYVDEIDTWENVTDHIEVNAHQRGTGKSSGWLSIDVLKELNG